LTSIQQPVIALQLSASPLMDAGSCHGYPYTGKWVGVGSGLGSDVIQPNPNPTPTQVFDASMGLG
jgi:hypothetical protein